MTRRRNIVRLLPNSRTHALTREGYQYASARYILAQDEHQQRRPGRAVSKIKPGARWVCATSMPQAEWLFA